MLDLKQTFLIMKIEKHKNGYMVVILKTPFMDSSLDVSTL